MNQKIKNASPKEFNGIKFKSKLEVDVYKTLLQANFLPEYEKHTWILFNGFTPTIPFYTKNTFKRKNKNIEVLSEKNVKDNRAIQDITYTPDFVFTYNNKLIIVEVKGFRNDTFPLKFKMFRKVLENSNQPVELWEIFTKRQLLECIDRLKA